MTAKERAPHVHVCEDCRAAVDCDDPGCDTVQIGEGRVGVFVASCVMCVTDVQSPRAKRRAEAAT